MGRKIQYIGQYQMDGQTLGKGNFARVELATHGVTKCKVAIKVIDTRKIKEEYVRNNLHREASVMAQLRHPNIIRLYETLKATSTTTSLYCLVTEYAAGGELLSFIKSQKDSRLTENTARPFIRQLISALHYFHERGVVHRDLKMENIMLDEKKKSIKIVDFGLSNTFSKDELLKTPCGSPEYAAPELFQVGSQYGPEVDIWSLGIIFYAAVIGRLPFTTPFTDQYRRQKLLQQIQKGLSSYHDKEMVLVAQDCRNLLRQIIEPVPELRLSLPEIESHPWTTRNGKLPFIPYQPPPKDKNMRAQVVEELSNLKNMDKKYVSDAVSENRADELSAMFNMMMDEQRKLQGLFEIDHTVPKDDKDIATVEKKSKLTKYADHGKRDKRSQNKTSKRHASGEASKPDSASGEANKLDSVDGKVEAEVIVEKTVHNTERAALTLPAMPVDGTTVTVSKTNGPVRVIQHPLTSKTNARSKQKDSTDVDTHSHSSTNPQTLTVCPGAEGITTKTTETTTLPQTESRGAEAFTVKTSDDETRSKIPTLRRIPKLDSSRDSSDRRNSKSFCELEQKPPDKPPRVKPLRPSTLQYRKNSNSDMINVRRTQAAYTNANKATGAIPKYTGYSPLIAPRAVPETLSSTDPTPDSMQTSLLTALEEKRKQSRTVSNRDRCVLKEDKVSENMEMLEQQISQIKCKDKDSGVRPSLVRYLSEPEHEDSGASQSSITGSHTLYPGSGPLVPTTNRPPVCDTALPKTDTNLLSCTSGNNTSALPISKNTQKINSSRRDCNSTSHVCRTLHNPVQSRLDNPFQRQDSNSNTMDDCADVFSSSPDHSHPAGHHTGAVLAWQPRAKTRSPLNSSSTDDSPVHGSPRLKRFPNINIQRKAMQMPIATVESYSEEDDDDDEEYYPGKPLISNYRQHHNTPATSRPHTASSRPRTSIGNGTRTSPTAIRLKAEKRRSSREYIRKYSKNGIFTSVPDNNLRIEPMCHDSSDSLAAETSTSSIKAGEGSLERLTNKARVHPMDMNKEPLGEEDVQSASNGSAKTSSKIPRPSGRLSRFQVFNLLQHDSDKTIKPHATSPTQKVDHQQLLLMTKYDQKRKQLTWRKGLSHLLGRRKLTSTNNNVTVASKTKNSNGTTRNSVSQQHRSQQDKYTEMDRKWTSPPSPSHAKTCNSMTVTSSPVPSNSASPAHQMFDISVSRSSTPSGTPQRKPPRKVGWAGCKECAKSDQSSDEGVDTSYTLERKVSATIVMQSLGTSAYRSESLKLNTRQATTQT